MGLQEFGWNVGRDVRIEYRWPSADAALMSAQAAELVSLQSEVILTHATPATAALRAKTQSIPNVFVVVNDPVGSGFVESIARPGGNSTGFTNSEPMVGSKWLELLKALKPRIARVGMLLNPSTSSGGLDGVHPRWIRTAAPAFGVSIIPSPFRTIEDIESSIAALVDDRTALIVLPDTSTTLHSRLIVGTAVRHRLPTIYPYRDFAVFGGLISYGVDRADLYGRAASYVDRILKGAKPADLPVQWPTKYELVINLKAAKVLGLKVSESLLARADEVIE